MSTVLGIYREPSCSPGRHRANDATILELVATTLEGLGHTVALATMDDAERYGRDASLVFSMSRSPAGLRRLTQWTSEGKTIVNAPAAVLNTSRDRLARRILAGTMRLPATRVLPTARALRDRITLGADLAGCWIKGGDLYASTREDVRRVGTRHELDAILDDFERRAISTAVLQEHVAGREIKFYAVGAGCFFHWLDVGETPRDHAAPAALRQMAADAGAELALDVFGGDLIVGADGSMTLIDMNDWPSFAPCPESAAAAIGRHLDDRLRAVSAGASVAATVRGAAPE